MESIHISMLDSFQNSTVHYRDQQHAAHRAREPMLPIVPQGGGNECYPARMAHTVGLFRDIPHVECDECQEWFYRCGERVNLDVETGSTVLRPTQRPGISKINVLEVKTAESVST